VLASSFVVDALIWLTATDARSRDLVSPLEANLQRSRSGSRVFGLSLELSETEIESEARPAKASRIDLNSPTCPLQIPIEAVNDNDAAEGAEQEQVMERRNDAMLRPLFSLVLCVPASSVPVDRVQSSDRTERRCRTVCWKTLCYCNSVLPGISGQLQDRLQSVLNAAARGGAENDGHEIARHLELCT